MRDSIIKNTGNSRYLKSAISAATTWEQFRAALIAGTLPIDLNGINTAGWQQVGDALNKANLLPDGIITAFGLPGSNPQVKDGISRLPWHKIREWTTAGSYTWTAPDLFNGRSYRIGVVVIGGGGSGGRRAAGPGSGTTTYTLGGGSGHARVFSKLAAPGISHNLVVGAGGSAVSGSSSASGNGGGTSSFDSVTAQGGSGGAQNASDNYTKGGQFACTTLPNPFGGALIDGVFGQEPIKCFNPFEYTPFLGAGGSISHRKPSSGLQIELTAGGKDPVTLLGGGDSSQGSNGGDATAPGCGGGACFGSADLSSGAGADGAVMIYVMGVEA